MSDIHLASTEEQLVRCYPVMAELRPHLSEADFLAQVARQREAGYKLAFFQEGGLVRSVAGYRYMEMLAWGKYLYVDDLITAEKARSKGFAQKLFAWLIAEARKNGCKQFHLDSGVHRFAAHRFYLGQRMDITSHHFAMRLE